VNGNDGAASPASAPVKDVRTPLPELLRPQRFEPAEDLARRHLAWRIGEEVISVYLGRQIRSALALRFALRCDDREQKLPQMDASPAYSSGAVRRWNQPAKSV
jgi:hypothetical protein